MNYLAEEEITAVLVEYVSDPRYRQAVLLDGEWGVGKSYYIKHAFADALKEKCPETSIAHVSLYGIRSRDNLEEAVCAKLLELTAAKQLGDGFAELLGKGVGVAKFLAKLHGLELPQAKELEKLREPLSGGKILLVFDDFERSDMDPVELMGCINDYVENGGYKAILIADERRMFYAARDGEEDAARYTLALDERVDFSEPDRKYRETGGTPPSKTGGQQRVKKDLIAQRAEWLFEREDQYRLTKEKLIGQTIVFRPDLKELFHRITPKYVKGDRARDFIASHEQEVADEFGVGRCGNLRTYISVCIAADRLLEPLLTARDGELGEFYEAEALECLRYIAHSLIGRNKDRRLEWPKDERHRLVTASFGDTRAKPIYGYRFVDEYLDTRCVSDETILGDAFPVVSEKKRLLDRRRADERHEALSLSRLRGWYYREDAEILADIETMKKELRDREYYPTDFKDIVVALMQINDPDFGFRPEPDEGEALFDAVDYYMEHPLGEAEPEGMESNALCERFEGWQSVDIGEYVALMDAYFPDGAAECAQGKLTKEMLRVVAGSEDFVKRYVGYVSPLLDRARHGEIEELRSGVPGEKGLNALEWDRYFVDTCKSMRELFYIRGVFLSLFTPRVLLDRLRDATPEEVENLCTAIGAIYNVANINEVFKADLPIVELLADKLKDPAYHRLNDVPSRTKKMLIVKLLRQLITVRTRLQRP